MVQDGPSHVEVLGLLVQGEELIEGGVRGEGGCGGCCPDHGCQNGRGWLGLLLGRLLQLVEHVCHHFCRCTLCLLLPCIQHIEERLEGERRANGRGLVCRMHNFNLEALPELLEMGQGGNLAKDGHDLLERLERVSLCVSPARLQLFNQQW